MKRVLVLLVAVALGSVMAGRKAHGRPQERGLDRTIRVGVMPFILAERFGEERLLFSATRELTERSVNSWQEVVETLVQTRDLVSLEGVEAVERSLLGARDGRALVRAESLFTSGLGHWRNLDPTRAMADLDAARNLLERGLQPLVSADRLADLEFHRGLALLDLGDETSAREAFERMFVLAPSKRFERGYYGNEVERVLVDASKRLSELDFPRYRFPLEQLAALAKRMRLDAIIIGVGWPRGDEGAELELAIFDFRSAEFSVRGRIDLSGRENPEERLDAMLSRWHTCAIEAPRGLARPRDPKRLGIDLSYVHGVWLKHRRTRDFLHGPGAQLGLTYALKPGLEFWARTSQRSTLSDSNGDLLDVFATTHLAAGIGLEVGDDTWRFLLRAGVDAALSLADIGMTTDVDCKFFGAGSPRCQSIFQASSPALWLGLDFSLGLRFAPTRSWYGTLQIGMTSYVLSPSVTDELNFPLYGTLGFGLPF
jgi:hypothetical protein